MVEDLGGMLSLPLATCGEAGGPPGGGELLIKARDAMAAATHTYDIAGPTVRVELFITSAITAWTYLLHAWFKREGIDYRQAKNQTGRKIVLKTAGGADKVWDLGKCLKHPSCPIGPDAKDNLSSLLELRQEIELSSITSDADAFGAEIQACRINFDVAIEDLFGGPTMGRDRGRGARI